MIEVQERRRVLRGAAAAMAGAVLVDAGGVPVTSAPAPVPEYLTADQAKARERLQTSGSLQVFDFVEGSAPADGGRLRPATYLRPDPAHRCRDRRGVDYVFDGARLLRGRPKAAGGKKARAKARAAARRAAS